MRETEAVKLYNSITNVSEKYIEEAQIRSTNREHKKRTSVWLVRGVAAACFCLLAAGLFVWRKTAESPLDRTPKITVSENGVVIPPLKVSLSAKTKDAACMVPFFIYQGRCYVGYETLYNADVSDGIIGELLGSATGLIDEWTSKDGYVDFAGSVKGDFYAVKGFNSEFILCMKDDSRVLIFTCNNGITVKTGAELYEDRLHLSGNYTGVRYETRNSWFYSRNELYALNDLNNSVIDNFITEMNAAEFMPFDSIPLKDGRTDVYETEIDHLYFLLENGLTVHLRLYEGGYVRFQGLGDVCVKIPERQFKEITDLFNNPAAWTPVEEKGDIFS
ncbi:MAG: hypothetical protein J1E35_04850 [Lachnospiraceae bacterium]|nr:hypothetical protein [Lachnospiraceae bacterium]